VENNPETRYVQRLATTEISYIFANIKCRILAMLKERKVIIQISV